MKKLLITFVICFTFSCSNINVFTETTEGSLYKPFNLMMHRHSTLPGWITHEKDKFSPSGVSSKHLKRVTFQDIKNSDVKLKKEVYRDFIKLRSASSGASIYIDVYPASIETISLKMNALSDRVLNALRFSSPAENMGINNEANNGNPVYLIKHSYSNPEIKNKIEILESISEITETGSTTIAPKKMILRIMRYRFRQKVMVPVKGDDISHSEWTKEITGTFGAIIVAAVVCDAEDFESAKKDFYKLVDSISIIDAVSPPNSNNLKPSEESSTKAIMKQELKPATKPKPAPDAKHTPDVKPTPDSKTTSEPKPVPGINPAAKPEPSK